MKILGKTLKDEISLISPAISNNPILPILEGIKISVNPGKAELQATDLQNTVTTVFDVQAVSTSWEAVVPPLFTQTVKSLQDETVTIHLNDNKVVMKTSSGGEFKIPTMAVADWPKIEDNDVTHEYIGSVNLDKVAWAASSDDLRPALSGVFWHQEDGLLTLVATDTFKMAILKQAIPSRESFSFILSRKVALKLDGELAIGLTEKRAYISLPDREIVSTLIEAKYPDYKSVIPSDPQAVVTAELQRVVNAVRSVSIYSNKVSRSMSITVEGNIMHIQSVDLDGGSQGIVSLPCESNADMHINLNSAFFAESISKLDTFKMLFHGHNRPIILDDNDLNILVMPILQS